MWWGTGIVETSQAELTDRRLSVEDDAERCPSPVHHRKTLRRHNHAKRIIILVTPWLL